MWFHVLALDYDGTIATDGVLDPEVQQAIYEVLIHGVTVVLVTGWILCLCGLAAATIPKPTIAPYAQYFRYSEVGFFANSFGPCEVW